MAAWMGYSVVSAFTIDVQGNAIQPMFGVAPATFTTIVPGAEWAVDLAPLSGDTDLGAVLLGLVPYVWFVGDPTTGMAVRIIPTNPPAGPNNLQLRVTAADLFTPKPNAAFIVGFALFRREGPALAT